MDTASSERWKPLGARLPVRTSDTGGQRICWDAGCDDFGLARGMTQKELADPKYSYAYVSTIEAGRRTAIQRGRRSTSRMRLGVTAPTSCSPDGPADLEARLELRLQEAIVSPCPLGRMEDVLADVPVGREGQRSELHLPEDPRESRRGAVGLWCERRSQPEEALAAPSGRREDLLRGEARHRSGSTRSPARRGASRRLGDVRYAIFLPRELCSIDSSARHLRDPDARSLGSTPSLVFAYLDAGICLARPLESGSQELHRARSHVSPTPCASPRCT